MNWIKAKHFTQRTWVWTKNYWYVPLLVVFALAALFVKRSDIALKLLKTRTESYKEQIDVLNESHTSEIAKRDEIIQVHQEVMEQLDEQLEEDLSEIEKNKEKRVKEIIKENHGDPEELSKALSNAFGITFVPRGN
jgi:flagellar biosynthesis/type III secretory pathway M-ring protein FliF/YscJ